MASNSQLEEKRNLADLTETIRSKYQALKSNEAKYQASQERFFKPVINRDAKNKKDEKNESTSNPETLSQSELNLLLGLIDDKLFGIEKRKDGWYMRAHQVIITPSTIKVDDQIHPTTRGLISLLTRKEPRNYTDRDLAAYASMLELTKRHLLTNSDEIKHQNTLKYKNILAKLFAPKEQFFGLNASNTLPQKHQSKNYEVDIDSLNWGPTKDDLYDLNQPSTSSRNDTSFLSAPNAHSTILEDDTTIDEETDDKKEKPSPSKLGSLFHWTFGGDRSGGGLGRKKKIIKPLTKTISSQYVYWNDLNELVERLYLLHMSKQAGNTSVVNEIASIESELREAKVIV